MSFNAILFQLKNKPSVLDLQPYKSLNKSHPHLIYSSNWVMQDRSEIKPC